MAETTTITRPAPVLEASLTNFLKAIDPLVGQKIEQVHLHQQLQQSHNYNKMLELQQQD